LRRCKVCGREAKRFAIVGRGGNSAGLTALARQNAASAGRAISRAALSPFFPLGVKRIVHNNESLQKRCRLGNFLGRPEFSLFFWRSPGFRGGRLGLAKWTATSKDLQRSKRYVANNVPQDDGSNCSIFSFDINANKSRLPLARNALKKLRTLRHPGVIKVLDTAEVGIEPLRRIGNLTNI
jgi:hypothetical protein